MLLGHRIMLLLCSHIEAGKHKCDLVVSTWTYFNSLLYGVVKLTCLCLTLGKQNSLNYQSILGISAFVSVHW